MGAKWLGPSSTSNCAGDRNDNQTRAFCVPELISVVVPRVHSVLTSLVVPRCQIEGSGERWSGGGATGMLRVLVWSGGGGTGMLRE